MAAKGVQRVKASFNKKLKEIDVLRTEAAIFSILSQGKAIADAMVPIDLGNLLNSGYAPQISKRSGKTVGEIGYTAAYAGYVHDAPGTLKGQPRHHFGQTSDGVRFGGGSLTGRYWDPAAQPGWLPKAFKELKPSIPAILKEVYGTK